MGLLRRPFIAIAGRIRHLQYRKVRHQMKAFRAAELVYLSGEPVWRPHPHETRLLPRSGLLRGPPAYVAKTPWKPLAALAATVGITLAGVLVAALFLGSTTLQG